MKHSMRQQGFSLIEILVGLAIGLLGMLIMMQVFTVTESGKRSTSGGDDAQTGGAIALYSLQRDIRQAGYGITNIRIIGCNVLLPNGRTLTAMAPITINHASIPPGDASTDTVLVVSGSGNGAQEGDGITAQPSATYPRTYSVQTITAFKAGDMVIAQTQNSGPVTPCNLTMEAVTSVTAGTNNVNVATGVAATANGYIYNMGAAPHMVAYAVRNTVLTSCDLWVADCSAISNVNNPAIWAPVASNIVSLRAVYGKDTTTPMDATIDAYNQTTPTTACGFSKVFSARIVLVARNASYDKADLTTTAPTWMESGNAAILLDDNDEWTHYRYKVFQTEVPIRNVISTGVVPSVGGGAPC